MNKKENIEILVKYPHYYYNNMFLGPLDYSPLSGWLVLTIINFENMKNFLFMIFLK